MTIANMRNEPKREITESAVGITAIIGAVIGGYYGTCYIQSIISWNDTITLGGTYALSALILLAIIIILCIAIPLTHFVGDLICGGLEDLGIQLRPIWRYQISVVRDGKKMYQYKNSKTGEYKYFS